VRDAGDQQQQRSAPSLHRARFTLNEPISIRKATFQPENIALAENRKKPRVSVFLQLLFHAFDQAGQPGPRLGLQLPFPSIAWTDPAPPGSRSPLPSSIRRLRQTRAGTEEEQGDPGG